jgi:hypothetical protein
MASIDDLLSAIPLDQLAGRLGVDEATAQQAVTTALPALIGGLEANAQDPAGAASLHKALAQHSPSLVEGGVNLDDVDTADGEKIVRNIFGSNEEQVVAQLADKSGTQSNVLASILPALAPIALSFLAKQLGGKSEQPAGTQEAAGGGGIGDLLGGLLGGGQGGSGGGLGSILGGLGGLLGGGKR